MSRVQGTTRRRRRRRVRALGRLLFTGIFIRGAWDLVREPAPRAEQARRLGVPVSDRFASLCGAVMIGAALALQVPPLRRSAALVLALELPVFTAFGHRFWEYEPGPQRVQNRLHFFKNVSLEGAALYLLAAPERR
jgi:putative oxidoreductase